MNRIFTLLFLALFSPTYAQVRQLSSAQMQHDLKVLHDAWVNLHPGLYRYITPAQLDSAFSAANSFCNTPRDERAFYLQLAHLATMLKCGHSYLNPLNLDDSTAMRVLPQQVVPFLFTVNRDFSLSITHSLSPETALPIGSTLTHLNGVATQTIIQKLLEYSRSDGRNGLLKQLSNLSETADELTSFTAFDIFYPLCFPSSANAISVTYRFHGRSHTVQMPWVSREERLKTYQQTVGTPLTGAATWRFEQPTNDIAVLSFGSFALWGSDFDGKAWIDSVFNNYILKPNIKYLFIDIQANEGGDNTGDYLLSYLTPTPIGAKDPDHPCYRYLTIPDSLLPYLSTWDPSFKMPKDSSLFFKNELDLWELKVTEATNYILPQPRVFKGKVVFLISAKNSSATYELARNVQTYQLGTLVGEPTGGCRQGINGGEFFFLTLPESKLEIDVPLIYNGHPNQPDCGILLNYTPKKLPVKTNAKTLKKVGR